VIVVRISWRKALPFRQQLLYRRIFQIGKVLTCTTSHVVYLARCMACNLQGVGSTVN
jgi:hypothetical protein